jgi:transposase-like protein
MEKQVEVRQPNGRAPDPEVSARPRRRTFTAEYKRDILKQVDGAERGDVGAILRREALYSSHLAEWRKERERGTLVALSKKRGPKPKKDPLVDENERLKRENEKLKKQLAQAAVIIDVQKKVASLLGIPLNTPETDESDS